MIKKLIGFFVGIFFVLGANAGQIANLEFAHGYLAQIIQEQGGGFAGGVTIGEINSANDPATAINMEYLLCWIDMINAEAAGMTTDYCSSVYATKQVADTTAVVNALDNLIVWEYGSDFPFNITTTANTSSFSFKLAARGTFEVDWGDGPVQQITRSNTTQATYTHTYATAGQYTIGIRGTPTQYTTSWNVPDISFKSNTNIAAVSGSLGALFPYLTGAGAATPSTIIPKFTETFYGCTNLATFPGDILDGLVIPAAEARVLPERMFKGMFQGIQNMTGSIPDDFFDGINGMANNGYMFEQMFYDCRALTGNIPQFRGITQVNGAATFNKTFQNCYSITGFSGPLLPNARDSVPGQMAFFGTFDKATSLSEAIPNGFFGTFAGIGGSDTFSYAFRDTAIVRNLPGDLFAGLEGTCSSNMFNGMFNNCTGLTADLPSGLFADLTDITTNDGCFNSTFAGSGITGIPDDLFGRLDIDPGRPPQLNTSTFWKTFSLCKNLRGESLKIHGVPVWQIWPAPADPNSVYQMYSRDDGLVDYGSIPAVYK
jgi:hypothetical protein